MRERRHGPHTRQQLKKNEGRLAHLQGLREAKRNRQHSEGRMLAQKTLGALNDELLFSLHEGVTHDVEVQLVGGGTWTCQLQIAPDGTTWVAALVTNLNSGAASGDMSAAGVFRILALPGVKDVRVRMTARTSGSAAVSVRATRST